MAAMIKLLKKLIVVMIGLPITLVGIILVPLPGPGLLVMFVGLFILSLEFDWAKKYVDEIKLRLGKLISDVRARSDSAGK